MTAAPIAEGRSPSEPAGAPYPDPLPDGEREVKRDR